MPTFTYKARNPGGEVVTGTQEAPSESEAARQLREQGFWVTELHARRGGSTGEPSPEGPTDVPMEDFLLGEAHPKDLALLYRQLAATVNAGMGLPRGLELAAIGTRGRLRKALETVTRKTAQGTSLAEAMAPRRELFGRAAHALLKAGEAGGRLEQTLRSAADHFERRWRLKQIVRRAMVYPVILLLASILIPAVPVALLQGTEAAIRMLAFQALFLIQFVLFYAAFRVVTRFEGPGLVWDTVLLQLPVIGTFVRKASAAKFLRTFADLYDVGISPLSALDIAADTCGNRYLARNLLRGRDPLKSGESLSSAFSRTGMLPPEAVQMMATGETSGDVGDLLNKVSDYMEGEVETATESFMRALPVLLWAVVAISIVFKIVSLWSGFAQKALNIE
ncbi:MAG: type II secretion system F family protein [Armatimonadetes bacterium]|nr:type II secretion system F family protein [Armatimonadota bacterium]